MTKILVQPPQLRKTAEELRVHAQKIDQALREIDADIGSLRGHRFIGNRADAVQAHYAPKRDALLTAKQMVIHFAEELTTAASVFEKADGVGGNVKSTEETPKETPKKTRVYLINGINYTNPKQLNDMKAKFNEDLFDVIILDTHPYDSNPKLREKGVDWVGVGQVEKEYVTGGAEESHLVWQAIKADLEKAELSGDIEDVILVGHSGGGAIVANIADEVNGMEGINLKGMVTMGSPMSNFDHASKYADQIIDIMSDGDQVGDLAGIGTYRSDEMSVWGSSPVYDGLFRDNYSNVRYENLDIGGHGSYFYSDEVVDIITDLALSSSGGGGSW